MLTVGAESTEYRRPFWVVMENALYTKTFADKNEVSLKIRIKKN